MSIKNSQPQKQSRLNEPKTGRQVGQSNHLLSSTARLWTDQGRIDVDVQHGPLATPDAIVEMGRIEADIAPAQFNRGVVR